MSKQKPLRSGGAVMKGWHFVSQDRRLGYGDGRIVKAGRTFGVKVEPVLCHRGLHASARILGALQYAPGPVICRVELGGRMVRGDDKAAATERHVLWTLDGTRLLHEFACRCAEDALKVAGVTDEMSWRAIEVKRRWIDGEADDKELAAAGGAAWVAARGAARYAAWGAARYAAVDAARDVVWGAAGDALNRRLTQMVMAERRRRGA